MKSSLAALALFAGTAVFGANPAAAVPVAGAQLDSATAAATEDAQYSVRRTKRGIRKCYREFVVGRWVCRTYRYW